MAANQLRLWFSAFAHLMLAQFQCHLLKGTRLAKATIGTLRMLLFKIAGRVKVSCRRIHFELASACPYHDDFAIVWKNLPLHGFRYSECSPVYFLILFP